MTTLSARIWNAPSPEPTTDSLVTGTARVRASTPDCAPRIVSVLLTCTSSLYVPLQTLIVSPGDAAVTAREIVGNVPVQGSELALPTVSVAAETFSTIGVTILRRNVSANAHTTARPLECMACSFSTCGEGSLRPRG